MNRECISIEIQDKLDGNTGCIVFDCAVMNYEAFEVDFKIQMGMEVLPDQKINRRYPNKRYRTLVKKTGRKLSKIGYPYFFNLSENPSGMWAFSIKIDLSAVIGEMIPDDIYDDDAVIDENCEFVVTEEIKRSIQIIFPLQINVTKEKPVCGLSLHCIPGDGTIILYSHNRDEKGWTRRLWCNKDEKTYRNRCNEFVLLHGFLPFDEEGNILIFDDVIEPFPSTLENLLV